MGDTFLIPALVLLCQYHQERPIHAPAMALQAPNTVVFQGCPNQRGTPFWIQSLGKSRARTHPTQQLLLQMSELRLQGVAGAVGDACRFIGPINISLRA